jgi:tetratricopeptide (TPR) repeat protein
MARRRRSRSKQPDPETPVPGEEASKEAAPAEADATDVDPAPTPEPEAEVSAPALPIEYDSTASDAIIRACAGIHSFAKSAAEEAGQAASPFLSFAQRSRIRALATDFSSARQTFSVQAAPATQAAAPVNDASLGREEIEAIVNHRIDIAVQEALQKLGVSPDATIPRQVERTVEIQLNSQEQRLLDYVKRHLTDSLEMLESTIEDRIADYIDAAELGDSDRETEEARAEIEAKVEEAREQLLKNIDEVREVQVGFDINNFASQIVEINDTSTGDHSAVGDEVLAMGDDEEIELGGEEEEIELGGEEEEEVEAATEEEVAPAAEVEVEAAPEEETAETTDDGSATEVELAPEDEIEVAGDEDAEIEVEVAGDEDAEIEVEAAGDEDAEIELGDDDIVEVEVADEAAEIELAAGEDLSNIDILAEDAQEIELGGDEDDEEDDASGTAATIELDSVDLEDGAVVDVELSDEPMEEISLIVPMTMDDDPEGSSEIELETAELIEVPDEDAQLKAGLELDLGPDEPELEDDDSENLALRTLGTGPDDLQVAPLEDLNELDSEVEVEVEVEIDDEEPASEEARANTIERYLQRAAEMRNRRQAAAAMELYSKVLDLDDDNYEARIGRGVLNLEAKDYKRAVEEFTRAEKIDASRPASALGLAEVHFHRKQFNKAIRHYTQCLKLDDKLAQAYCNRGLSYYYQKNYKKAFLDLMRAYDIDSELPNIKKYLKLVRNKVKSEKG